MIIFYKNVATSYIIYYKKSLRDNFSKLNAFSLIKPETIAVTEIGLSKEVSDVHRELVERIKFILSETDTNIVEASRKMRSESFE